MSFNQTVDVILKRAATYTVDQILSLPERPQSGHVFRKSYADVDFANISHEDQLDFMSEITYDPMSSLLDYFSEQAAEFAAEFEYGFEEEFIVELLKNLNERSYIRNGCVNYTLANGKIIQTYDFTFLKQLEVKELTVVTALHIYLCPIYEKRILELANQYLSQLFLSELK